jgi:hypothetical protein
MLIIALAELLGNVSHAHFRTLGPIPPSLLLSTRINLVCEVCGTPVIAIRVGCVLAERFECGVCSSRQRAERWNEDKEPRVQLADPDDCLACRATPEGRKVVRWQVMGCEIGDGDFDAESDVVPPKETNWNQKETNETT